MTKDRVKNILISSGIDVRKIVKQISSQSISSAAKENKLNGLIKKLRDIAPDISDQESSEKNDFNDYTEIKRRSLQAFQCSLMLKALERLSSGKLTVVDIGDSAGTHMLYLKELTKDRFDIDTVSVNLDPRAIKKIKARGLDAVLCRAEDLSLGNKPVDLFTSFQMVEHLHNPAIFFRRLAKRSVGNRLLITVPYRKTSRVGLHNLRNNNQNQITAEEEHIFELSPGDWKLLILHSGWKVVYEEVYYQYPRRYPLISCLLGWFWEMTDFEGFWGAVLEKDTTISDRYQDWEE